MPYRESQKTGKFDVTSFRRSFKLSTTIIFSSILFISSFVSMIFFPDYINEDVAIYLCSIGYVGYFLTIGKRMWMRR